MARVRFAVDSRDGYTAEFLVDLVGTQDEQNTLVEDEARRVVTELFPPSRGPFEVWDVERDVHVLSVA